MALIQCAECGNQVSTTALACPHCGAKKKPKSNSDNLWGGLALFALVVVLVVGVAGNKPDPLAEARKRDREVFEFCVADMNDPLRSFSHREAARSMCEMLRADFQRKYGRAP